VKGLAKLGDAYPWYNVWISGGRDRCDCFFRAYGYVRKARICSHIATVMLYKAAEARGVAYKDKFLLLIMP